jgi:hypothetical protein
MKYASGFREAPGFQEALSLCSILACCVLAGLCGPTTGAPTAGYSPAPSVDVDSEGASADGDRMESAFLSPSAGDEARRDSDLGEDRETESARRQKPPRRLKECVREREREREGCQKPMSTRLGKARGAARADSECRALLSQEAARRWLGRPRLRALGKPCGWFAQSFIIISLYISLFYIIVMIEYVNVCGGAGTC